MIDWQYGVQVFKRCNTLLKSGLLKAAIRDPNRIARLDPVAGVALRRVLAPNPSALTGPGTNTWLLGRGAVTVIDPGPALPAHLAAILAALDPGERIAQIVVEGANLPREQQALINHGACRHGRDVEAAEAREAVLFFQCKKRVLRLFADGEQLALERVLVGDALALTTCLVICLACIALPAVTS